MNQHSFSLLSVLACSAALLFVACSGDEDSTPAPEGTAGTSSGGSSSGGSGGSGTAGTESGGSGGSSAGAGGSDTAGSGGTDAAGAGGSDAAGSGGSDAAGSGGSEAAGSGGSDAGAGGSGGQAGPSFAADVKPILDAKCASCHTSGSSGGWQTSNFDSLLTDSGVCSGKTKGACVIERIKNGSMPLGKGCTGDPAKDAANAACLTAEEQDKIQAWVDGGLNP